MTREGRTIRQVRKIIDTRLRGWTLATPPSAEPFREARVFLRSIHLLQRRPFMARFRWHADYFAEPEGGNCVRRDIISADNAGEAEKLALAGLGACARVEVRRVGTAAPVRVLCARKLSPGPVVWQPAGIFSFAAMRLPGLATT
jgi:hypothetical protein